MNYPSKTFKIRPMYRMLYQSSIDVLSQDKSPLTIALLEKEVGIDKLNELQQFEFNDLIEKMIYDLKKEVFEASYEDVEFFVNHHDRLLIIKELFKQKHITSEKTILSFRIPEIIVEEVYKLKKRMLGDVVELAIGLYTCRCDEITFELIRLAFQHYAPKRTERF